MWLQLRRDKSDSSRIVLDGIHDIDVNWIRVIRDNSRSQCSGIACRKVKIVPRVVLETDFRQKSDVNQVVKVLSDGMTQ